MIICEGEGGSVQIRGDREVLFYVKHLSVRLMNIYSNRCYYIDI